MSRKYTSVRFTRILPCHACRELQSAYKMGRAGTPSSSEKCRIMQQRSRLEDDSEAQRHRCMTRQNGVFLCSLSPPAFPLSATPPLSKSLWLPLSRLPLPLSRSVQNQLELFLRPERAIKIRKFDYCLRPRFTQAQFPVPSSHWTPAQTPALGP